MVSPTLTSHLLALCCTSPTKFHNSNEEIKMSFGSHVGYIFKNTCHDFKALDICYIVELCVGLCQGRPSSPKLCGDVVENSDKVQAEARVGWMDYTNTSTQKTTISS